MTREQLSAGVDRARAFLAGPWGVVVLAGVVVLLLVVAYFAGNHAAPAKTVEKVVTVEKTVRDEKAIEEAVARARAEWSKSVQDHTVTKTRTVLVQGKPVEIEKIVYVDRDSQASGSSESSSSEANQTEVHEVAEDRTEALKVVEAETHDWRGGVAAWWKFDELAPKPHSVSLEVDRRLIGPVWIGIRAKPDIASPKRSEGGAAIAMEW